MNTQMKSGKKLWETPQLICLDVKSTRSGTLQYAMEGIRVTGSGGTFFGIGDAS